MKRRDAEIQSFYYNSLCLCVSAFQTILVFLFLCFSFPVQAQTYTVGTLGYLYEDCLAAIEKSETFEQLHNTYCGAFAEGYAVGLMAAHGLEFENTPERDACWDEREMHYKRINARFCPHLPAFDENTADPAYIFENTIHVVSYWISFLYETQKNGDPLAQPVSPILNDMLRGGAFCDALGVHDARAIDTPDVNPALLQNGSLALLSFQQGLAQKDKHAQCIADLDYAGNDSARFLETRCGAEISGFLIGIQGTAHLQENIPQSSVQCEKEIARLYKVLDTQETMCVDRKTDALEVAQIYVDNFEKLESAPALFPWLDWSTDVNSIGYDVIYRGFLCVNER